MAGTQRERTTAYQLANGDDGDALDQWQQSASLDNRVALQASVTWSGLQDGSIDAGANDPANPYNAVWWVLQPVKTQHCFPAGTEISVLDGGTRPIEEIRVGELVQTMAGPRRVTRLYCSAYHGELVRVRAGEHEVCCTPNHPFLTQRGWIEAGSLCNGDQVMLAQDAGEFVTREIRLPDAHYGVAARTQVGILGAVSTLLPQLPLGQRGKAGMAVPVVAIGLNDERADANVHHELFFDERRRLKGDTHLGQHVAQPLLQFAWLVALHELLGRLNLRVERRNFIGMARTPRSNLRLHFRSLHRILLGHKSARSLVNQAAARLRSETRSSLHIADLVSYLVWSQAKRLSHELNSFLRVVLAQVGGLLGGPPAVVLEMPTDSDGRTRFTAAARTNSIISPAHMSALGTGLPRQLARALRRPLDRLDEVRVSARYAAEAPGTRTTPMLGERLPALLTDKLLRRHSDASPFVPSSIIQQSITVYNFEVEEMHHYIAGGFVVHNCDDCIELATKSPYDPPWDTSPNSNQLNQSPGDGQTECGAGCKCELDYKANWSEVDAIAAAAAWQVWLGQAASDLAAMQQIGTAAGYEPGDYSTYIRQSAWANNANENDTGTGDGAQNADLDTAELDRRAREYAAQQIGTAAGYAPGFSLRLLPRRIPVLTGESAAEGTLATTSARDTLTSDQQSALDSFRSAAAHWNAVRSGDLPVSMRLFATEDDAYDALGGSGGMPPYDQLTPEQQEAMGELIAALWDWGYASGELENAGQRFAEGGGDGGAYRLDQESGKSQERDNHGRYAPEGGSSGEEHASESGRGRGSGAGGSTAGGKRAIGTGPLGGEKRGTKHGPGGGGRNKKPPADRRAENEDLMAKFYRDLERQANAEARQKAGRGGKQQEEPKASPKEKSPWGTTERQRMEQRIEEGHARAAGQHPDQVVGPHAKVEWETERVHDAMREKLGQPNLTDRDFAELMGAVPGGRVEAHRSGEIVVHGPTDEWMAGRYVFGPSPEEGGTGARVYHTFYRTQENGGFEHGQEAPADLRYAEMLRTEVNAAHRLGTVSRIVAQQRLVSGGQDDPSLLDGFRLIPMGFDSPMDEHMWPEIKAYRETGRVPDFAHTARSASDLYLNPSTRGWWRDNVTTPHLSLDLTPGSDGLIRLHGYLRAHGKHGLG